MRCSTRPLRYGPRCPPALTSPTPGVLGADLKATREALHAAVDRLGDEPVARAVGSHLERRTRPAPLAPLAELAAADALGEQDAVVLRPGLRCTLTRAGDRVALRCLDKTIDLPALVGPALRRLLDAGHSGAALRAGGLPGLDAADGVTLTRRLLHEGVVVPSTFS